MSDKIYQFSNGTRVIKHSDGTREVLVSTAQSTQKQTQPLDIEEEVGNAAGVGDAVPRDKSVGLDQTDADYQEYEAVEAHGDGGSDESIVPRSKGNSGMEGQDKTDFEDELADDATSGNPDSYVQDFTPSEKASPAGSKENHCAEEVHDFEVLASDDVDFLKSKIAQLETDLEKERTLRKREAIARQIVSIEQSAGLIDLGTESEFESEVESRLNNPVEILQRDLDRVKSFASMISAGKITKSASVKSAGIANRNQINTVAVQSLFYNPEGEYSPTLGVKEASRKDSIREYLSVSTLGREFKK